MHLTSGQIAHATGGHVLGGEVVVDGACIDSRGDVAGKLFIPIVAERDGHAYIKAAQKAGAAAYLTTMNDQSGSPAIQVSDTMDALCALGKFARDQLPDRVVGITGSVGKTSTKDLLAGILRTTFRTHENQASFNNEMGVPLTLLSADDDVEVVVCEMGARGIGHVAFLCEIARPTVAIVTAVEGAHLEMFGSLENIAQAKGELVEALPQSGAAVLNADNAYVNEMATRSAARAIRYGVANAQVDVHASDISLDRDLRPAFVLETPWGNAPVRLAAHGIHQVPNALGAASAALWLGVPIEAAVDALERTGLSPMRMDVVRREDGLVVIDDSYNANPTSMAAALQSLTQMNATRKIAVLGFMAEIGADEAANHHQIALLAAELGVTVLAVGTDLYGETPLVATDAQNALHVLTDLRLGAGDAVLIKGSRVAGLEYVARVLASEGNLAKDDRVE